MATLVLALTMLLQVATTSDLRCLGFIRQSPLPADVFIAGTQEEGVTALSWEGQIAYLNGPAVASLKPGGIYSVVRPEGRLGNHGGQREYGVYYRALGTVRVERLEPEAAVAIVTMSCQAMTKGDLVIPALDAGVVEYKGDLSNRLTSYPGQGLASVIILGKDDQRTLGAGNFCFIGVGSRDGVKAGDRFTIYNLPPGFDRRDLLIEGEGWLRSYRKMRTGTYDPLLFDMLRSRKLPPSPLGDLVVVDVGEDTAAARIVNSLAEISPGDVVVRR